MCYDGMSASESTCSQRCCKRNGDLSHMVDIKEYLRKKEKNEKKDSKNFKREIRGASSESDPSFLLRNWRDRSADGDGGNAA